MSAFQHHWGGFEVDLAVCVAESWKDTRECAFGVEVEGEWILHDKGCGYHEIEERLVDAMSYLSWEF